MTAAAPHTNEKPCATFHEIISVQGCRSIFVSGGLGKSGKPPVVYGGGIKGGASETFKIRPKIARKPFLNIKIHSI